MLLQNYSFTRVPFYFQRMLDEIGKQNQRTVILHNILMVMIFTAIMGVSMFMMRKLIIGVSRKIEYELRERIYHKLLSLDYIFYQENQTGDLMSRCTNDLDHVRTLLGPGVMYIPNSITRIALFLPILLHLSPSLVFWFGICLILLVIVILSLFPVLRPMFRQIQEAMGFMNNRVWQVISGISSIKQYTAEKIETHRFEDLNKQYIKKQMRVVRLEETMRPLFFLLLSISELVILWVGGSQVIQGKMTLGQLLQFNVMISLLTFPMLALGWIMSLIQQGISAMNRINYILDKPVEDESAKKTLPESVPVLTVRNLTFSYPRREDKALQNINLTIKPGQTIGITGPVGCGKSTLLNVMTGLMKPGRGQVFVDDTDICDARLEDFYKKIGVVSQVPFLFSRSISDNITLGPKELDEETIRQAADNAGLEKDIESFPEGLRQLIGERGIMLSGGQKQRVAIARALGKCSPILIMDDPLSSVDSKTEEHILNSLKIHRCYSTLILVSHRISVLKITDVIYVMDKGTVVEEGNHTDLIRQNGLYARLARLQQLESENGNGTETGNEMENGNENGIRY